MLMAHQIDQRPVLAVLSGRGAGIEVEAGQRVVLRAIQDPLAEAILAGTIKPNASVAVTVDDDDNIVLDI